MTGLLDNTIGSIFIGVQISAVLWGAGALQAFNYFTSHQNDPSYVKAAVLVALITDTIHQALISNLLYDYTITHFGDIVFLLKIQSSLPAQIVLQQLTGTIVQSFFAYRIFRLSECNLYMITPVIVAIVSQLSAGIVYAVKTARISTFLQLNDLTTPSFVYAAFVVTADLLIAVILTLLLQRARVQPSERLRDPMKARIDTTVQRLIVLTMTNGLLCTICAIGVLFSYVALSTGAETFAYIPFFFIAGRLYFNSLLAALNMRTYARKAESARMPAESATLFQQPHSGQAPRSAKIVDLAQVEVNVLTHSDEDIELATATPNDASKQRLREEILTHATASLHDVDHTFQEITLVDNEAVHSIPPSIGSPIPQKATRSPSSRTWVGPRPRRPSEGVNEIAATPSVSGMPIVTYKESHSSPFAAPTQMHSYSDRINIEGEPNLKHSEPLLTKSGSASSPTTGPCVRHSSHTHRPFASSTPMQAASPTSPSLIRPLPILPGAGVKNPNA